MRKKIGIWGMIFVLAVTAFTGCGAKMDTDGKKDTKQEQQKKSGWDMADDIVRTVEENQPEFADYRVDIEDFGGEYLEVPLEDTPEDKEVETELAKRNTQAIEKAMEHITENEKDGKKGGTLVIHDGYFYTAAIHMESNVELHLEDGANVMFTTDYAQYPNVLTRWGGVLCYNYSPFIYAYQKENIAVTGKGTFYGQATKEKYWLPWKHGTVNVNECEKEANKKLRQMGQDQVPVEERVFGEGSYLRPAFVQPYECKNVLLEGITIKDAPFWMVQPVFCENVIIRDVTVDSFGYNNDGINPDSCRYVLIENCTLHTGDDAVAIKSGLNKDGETIGKPSEYIVVRNNEYLTGKGSAATIGSDMSGGVRYIFFIDNHSADTCEHLQSISLKTNGDRGGTIEQIYISGLKAEHVEDYAVYITKYYEEADTGLTSPEIKDIFIKDCDLVAGEKGCIGILGYDRAPVKNVSFENCTFTGSEHKFSLWNVEGLSFKNVTFDGEAYPDGEFKTDIDHIEILEESVRNNITVRYSCGALESDMSVCWYESDTEDGEYKPIEETDTLKAYHDIMEDILTNFDASKYYKLGITVNGEEYLAGPYHAEENIEN